MIYITEHTESITDAKNNYLKISNTVTTYVVLTMHITFYGYIPAKPLHSSDLVSVYFNHCYCTEIWDNQ